MTALWNRQVIIFLPFGFYLSSSSFFPSLISAVTDWMYTWRGLSANLECRSEMCCVRLAGNAGPKSRHLSTIAELCRAISSQLRHISTIGKKFVKQQCFPTCPCYGELRPTSGWDLLASLRHPCKFQQICVLAALLHGTLVVDVSQTLRHWTEGATYIQQGGHHIGHWPTFLVLDLDYVTFLLVADLEQRKVSRANQLTHADRRLVLLSILQF